LRKRAKKSPLNDSKKPFCHRYTAAVIRLSLNLYGKAALGCRKVARVLDVFFALFDQTVPHHTTIRLWILRNGYYELKKPIQQADDWVAIGDVTVDLGKVKCLTILGVQLSRLSRRGDYTLTHNDVEILGLYPTQK
jgi:hypothetical protein